MPARRLEKRKRRLSKKANFYTLLFFLVLVIGIVLIPRSWRNDERLSVAVQRGSGDVQIIIFDPISSSITSIHIPKETEVSVSRQLGRWRLGSVWQLGEQEGYSGMLLSETITKALKIPTEAWAQQQAIGFSEIDPLGQLKALFSFYKSNFTIRDRINLALFGFKTKSSGKVEINLVDTGYLEKTKLADGELGYKVKSLIPSSLVATLADSKVSQEKKLVTIVNKSGSDALSKEIGEIVEVLGAKVFSILTQDTDETDCVVEGSDSETVRKISGLFSCEVKDSSEDELDVKVVVGKKFLERY